MKNAHETELNILRFAVPALLITFGFGYFSAQTYLDYSYGSHHNVYTLSLSTAKDEEVEIIRGFDKWLLVRKASNELTWIDKSIVQSIKLVRQGKAVY